MIQIASLLVSKLYFCNEAYQVCLRLGAAKNTAVSVIEVLPKNRYRRTRVRMKAQTPASVSSIGGK